MTIGVRERAPTKQEFAAALTSDLAEGDGHGTVPLSPRSPGVPMPSSRYNTSSFISARFLPLHHAPGLQQAPGTPRPDR
jgi:hypothetical protein